VDGGLRGSRSAFLNSGRSGFYSAGGAVISFGTLARTLADAQ
jgi:hypothetical protein